MAGFWESMSNAFGGGSNSGGAFTQAVQRQFGSGSEFSLSDVIQGAGDEAKSALADRVKNQSVTHPHSQAGSSISSGGNTAAPLFNGGSQLFNNALTQVGYKPQSTEGDVTGNFFSSGGPFTNHFKTITMSQGE